MFAVSLKSYGSFKTVACFPLIQSKKDSIVSLQKEIDLRFSRSLTVLTSKHLDEYDLKLSLNQEGYSKNTIRYWKAYLQYKKAVFYLIEKKLSASEKSCDLGINLLNDIKEKSVEDYALLAYLESFSIQFKGAKVLLSFLG